MKKGTQLTFSLLLPLAVGYSASLFTIPEIDGWYRGLQKPSWSPPNSVFAPVWTSLYILMGLASFIFWNKVSIIRQSRLGTLFYLAQLVFNFCWSLIFFRLHQPGWALADIALLWISIIITIFLFGRVSKLAAWLLVPYLCWVSFAAALNYSIWKFN